MLGWRIAKERYATDLSGYGAMLEGGRWNSQGVPVLYVALEPSTAAMELLVHISDELPDDLVIMKINLPDDPELYLEYAPTDLPPGWDANPSATVASKVGDTFVQENKYLGIIVPSSIIMESRNLVINPRHPRMRDVSIEYVRPFKYDARLRP